MGKKCIPGLFCVDNMVLFVLMIILLLAVYAFYRVRPLSIFITNNSGGGSGRGGGGCSSGVCPTTAFDDGLPPRNILSGVSLPELDNSRSGSVVNWPIHGAERSELRSVETQPSSGYQYVQIGLLMPIEGGRGGGGGGNIMPLMGRRVTRNKWQYYAVSNSNLSLKLPIKYRGKSGSYEYGCDEISSGDTVTVVGQGEYTAEIYNSNWS